MHVYRMQVYRMQAGVDSVVRLQAGTAPAASVSCWIR